MITDLTLNAIKAEGFSQDRKWGEQNHEPEIWLAILTEEVGELAQAMLADRFDYDEKMHDSHHVSMETEAIQVAAVAAQFVEYLSRRAQNGNAPDPTGAATAVGPASAGADAATAGPSSRELRGKIWAAIAEHEDDWNWQDTVTEAVLAILDGTGEARNA